MSKRKETKMVERSWEVSVCDWCGEDLGEFSYTDVVAFDRDYNKVLANYIFHLPCALKMLEQCKVKHPPPPKPKTRIPEGY